VIGRRQLPVASPISGASLARAVVDATRASQETRARARDAVARAFDGRNVLLTDSGTSALVLALRATASGGTVALPAYGCVDLVAAALLAGVRIRLYDIDPATLSPDLESVQKVVARGVDAIVVAHLFGYAADIVGVQLIAAASGVAVIEDAAQGAGASLNGKRLGSLGALAIVSFGRGKGLCAAGGGAVLANDVWSPKLDALAVSAPRRGWSGLAGTAIQWMLGRPSIYALPSALPWLHLGEMIYHPATDPAGVSWASASLVSSAFALEERDLAVRRARARDLDAALGEAEGLVATAPIASSHPSYLRYAVRDVTGRRTAQAALGIVKPYPGTVATYPQIGSSLAPGEPPMTGANEIARSLLTLPSHRFVARSDLTRLGAWAKHIGR